jgi:hypothetical protein
MRTWIDYLHAMNNRPEQKVGSVNEVLETFNAIGNIAKNYELMAHILPEA